MEHASYSIAYDFENHSHECGQFMVIIIWICLVVRLAKCLSNKIMPEWKGRKREKVKKKKKMLCIKFNLKSINFWSVFIRMLKYLQMANENHFMVSTDQRDCVGWTIFTNNFNLAWKLKKKKQAGIYNAPIDSLSQERWIFFVAQIHLDVEKLSSLLFTSKANKNRLIFKWYIRMFRRK